jgi:hypothetical protein
MASSFLGGSKKAMAAKAGLAALAVGAVAAGKALYDVGEEFEQAYDRIQIATGKSGKQLERLRKDFKNVVSSVPTDFKTAAEAIGALNSRLEISGKPLRRLSKQFLEMSRLTETDVGENIKSVTRAFGDWEVATGKQSEQLDIFFRASQMSGGAVSEIADLVVKFGAPLRVFGFELNEATAMFASFEKAGVNIQTMMPGLKMALKNFGLEDRDPKKALAKTFKGIETGAISSSKAMEIFGQRAGFDMMEAVNQGRFHLDKFTRSIEKGKSSIMGTSKEHRGLAENMTIMANRIKVLLEPASRALVKVVDDISKALVKVNFKKAFRDMGPTVKEIGFIIKRLVEIFRTVFGPQIRSQIQSFIQYFKGMARVVKGIVQVIGGILKGDFRQIWAGVKNIFGGGVQATLALLKGVTAPIRQIIGRIGSGMKSGFTAAWNGVKSVFKTGANAVIGFVNGVIDAINIIPGVDIGHVGEIGGGGGGRQSTGTPRNAALRKQRGGHINMGVPGRDSVHAELELDEYVLNKKAVKRLGGPRVLDQINFGMAPRFGMAIGGFVGDVLSKGAGALIDKLPKPNIPEPLTGVGPWILKEVGEWIKGQFQTKKLGSFIGLGGGSAMWGQVDALAQQLGLVPGTLTGRLGESGSWHGVMGPGGRARATDYSGPAGGMLRFGTGLAQSIGRKLEELIYTPMGFSIDSGQRVAPYAEADHYDHVHVAMAAGGSVGAAFANAIKATSAPYRAALALFSAGIVESGMKNLSHGHADSTGALQVRASTAGPMGIDPMNPGQVARVFLTKGFWGKGGAISLAKQGIGPGAIAQMVQGSAYPSRYSEVLDQAAALLKGSGLRYDGQVLKGLGASGGGGGGGASSEERKKAQARAKAERRKGQTGKGGGTFGPYGKSRANERDPRTTESVPGIGKAPKLGEAAMGLGETFQKMLSVPGGLNWAGKMAVGDFALEQAELSEDGADDIAAQKFRIAQMKKRKRNVQQQLAKINKALGTRMNKKRQTALLRKRDALQGTLREMMGGIASARAGIADAAAGPEGFEEEGGETEAQRAAREAQEAHTRALEEHAAAMKEHSEAVAALRKEMVEQRKFADRESKLSGTVMMKALADMLANYLGPVSSQHARVAGHGTVGAL